MNSHLQMYFHSFLYACVYSLLQTFGNVLSKPVNIFDVFMVVKLSSIILLLASKSWQDFQQVTNNHQLANLETFRGENYSTSKLGLPTVLVHLWTILIKII